MTTPDLKGDILYRTEVLLGSAVADNCVTVPVRVEGVQLQPNASDVRYTKTRTLSDLAAIYKNAVDLTAEIEAAAKELRKNPKDEHALDALDQAIERLKRHSEPTPAVESKPNHP